MSELDQLYQEFYADVTAKIWADYEDFKNAKTDYFAKAQVEEFQYLLLNISGNFSHSYEDPEVNKINYQVTAWNNFRGLLIQRFDYYKKKICKDNPVQNFLEERLKKIIIETQYSFAVPSKEILAKTFAFYDAYIDTYEQLKSELDKENSFPIMTVKQTLLKWLADGENERVVDALQDIANKFGDTYFVNDVTFQAGRYASLKKRQQQNVISEADAGIELAKIRQALIDLINKIPEGTILESQPVAPGSPVTIPPVKGATASTPLNKPEKDQIPPVVWISGLVILIGITILTALIPCPAEALLWTMRVLMSIGAAMAATVLPGLLNINLPNVKAGSALAVLVLVYLFNPAKIVENNSRCNQPQYTSVTVFVHGKTGRQEMILRQQGSVIMDVSGGERKRASINENGQAFFQNLRVGDTVQLNVDFSEPYKATQPDAEYVIENQGSIYLETALQGLDKVFGTVIWRDQPLSGVLVTIGDLRDTTDATGRYSIDIPESAQKKEQEVQFLKKAFKMLMKKAYPQTNEPLNIIMEK
jgi:hypothetical protein